MSAVADAAQALLAAVSTVPGVRSYQDLSAVVDPPAVVVGPPRLYWELFDPVNPTRAVFEVLVVAKADDRTMDALWDLVPAVAAAVNTYDQAALDQNGAQPTVFTSGGIDLPAYSISVTVILEG